MKVSIKYNNILELSKIVVKLNHAVQPQIILWYIGSHGLKKTSVNFHKNIIAPIYKNNFNSYFCLYDLTAWSAIRNSNIDINKDSRHVSRINCIDSHRIKCLTSSKIFNKIQNITDIKLVEYFKTALTHDFIWKNSRNRPSFGITIGDLFQNNCPLLQHYFSFDTSVCYSMLQYLEGCLIVDEIISSSLEKGLTKEVQIFFVLPNDEITYYYDPTNAFEKDITFLINQKYPLAAPELKVNITFFQFKYGESQYQRPYHGSETVPKSYKLQKLHVMN